MLRHRWTWGFCNSETP